jgi:formylglycine-generating enzyme required for sulfatase activity
MEDIFEIEDGVLERCTDEEVESVTVPDGVTEIGGCAFDGCYSLSSVVIPNSVTKIGYDAFRDCASLTSVEIPSSVTEIGRGAFEDCKSLSSVDIPNSVTEIGDNAFERCAINELSHPCLTIKNGCAVEGNKILYCSNQRGPIIIPNGVTEIDSYAFIYCESLASVVIPNSVTEIGDEAFRNCESLESVEFGGTMEEWTNVEGNENLFGENVPLTSVKCADGVWEKPVLLVRKNVAVKCLDKSAKDVTIPDGVTEIGITAFSDCESLSSVVIPSSVTKIDKGAFVNCKSLLSVAIPSSVTEIGDGAFLSCESLLSVEFGGTAEQWNAVEKAGWFRESPIKSVKCADGEVKISDTISVDSESKLIAIPGTKYWMGQTPVTQRLYQKVMGENPSYHQLSNDDLDDDEREALEEEGDTANNPVEEVSWFDAVYFCNKLSIKEGLTPAYSVDGETDPESWGYTPHQDESIDSDVDCDFSANGYRLPTNDEWENAADGGESYTYSGSDDLDEVGWYDDNSNNVTHPVAQNMANGYGLYDMSGNVCEWVWESTPDNPVNRFYRGGSCCHLAVNCGVSNRYGSRADGRDNYLGFRLLRPLD